MKLFNFFLSLVKDKNSQPMNESNVRLTRWMETQL